MARFFNRDNRDGERTRPDGLPGLQREDGGMSHDVAALLLTGSRDAAPVGALRRDGMQGQAPIGREEIARAAEILQKYKAGKANLEKRVVEDELWWELRHWEAIRSKKAKEAPKPVSAWLFNAIINKHADAMDNYPEPVVLPRERSDEESARILSSVLPVALENCGYAQTYSDACWEKIKHGTGVYGVFWNTEKENGLGDVDVRQLDLLKIFWEPGVTDLQASRNLFIVELVDEDLLEQQYPEHKGKLGGSTVDVKQYVYDDTVDVSGKSVVVDWYYKLRRPDGRTALHYVKFVGDTLLYASQNDPQYAERGFYDHGLYPVVADVLFPEKGMPVGFGYVAVCKDPQLYIDQLSGNILENAMQATRRRYFASKTTGVNREQFLDWNEPIVEVEGELDERRLRELDYQPLSGIYVSVLQMKIDEMKDTAANRDVNSGGTGGGVTAAAAIAALQEAGNKVSRDMIGVSYRAHVEVCKLVLELMRQFYDESRSFRVTGSAPGSYSFVDVDNAALKDQPIGTGAEGETLYRHPVFDLKVSAQKRSPFSRMEQNERAKELYGLGFFNPDRAQEALGALEMMDFESIDKVREQVQQGDTLMNVCRELAQQVEQLTAVVGAAQGGGALPTAGGPAAAGGAGEGAGSGGAVRAGAGPSEEIMRARQPMTGYGQRLAQRSAPEVPGV